MAKTRVALEITEAGVRAVEVTAGRHPVILTAGEVPLPEGAAKDSEILDRDAVAMALQRLWADARISSREVVLGVGNRRILVREHSTHLTNPDHIRQALPFEVQDRLPVPVDQAVLDFVPTRQDEAGVHGLLVAAVAEHMEELVEALAQAKLRPVSVDLTAFGHARALAALCAPGETGLFLGIGEHTTHIVIATDGVPRFVRVVPIDIVPSDAAVLTMAPSASPPEDLRILASPAVVVASTVPPSAVTSAGGQSASTRRERRAAAGSVAVLDRPDGARIPATAEPGQRDLPPTEARLHPDVQAALIDLVGRLRGTVGFYRDRPDAVAIDRTFIAGAHASHGRLIEAVGRVTETPVTVVTATDLLGPPRGFTLPTDVGSRLVGTAALLIGDAR